jgi:tyrosyl-tRNA synthetase
MTQYQSLFLNVLAERGFIHQVTDGAGLDALLLKQVVPAYIGFDCTANSLHVGSLVQIMILRWLQKTGHKPIVLMGGATTKIGDPSGKDESRPPLSDAQIAENMAGIQKVFTQFLKFGDGKTDAVMVNNADWLSKLNYIDFLRDYGRYFSVNRMLSMDSVKLRLQREQNLSFLEFNYMIMQAYDFVSLAKRSGVRLQIGGSDQWGNIVMGVDLNRKMKFSERLSAHEEVHDSDEVTYDKHGYIHAEGGSLDEVYSRLESTANKVNSDNPVFGLTTPLLTTSSGAKMGKTAAGAVWLNLERLSAYDYYQFWRNTEDADVGRFLKLFTELPMDTIGKLEALQGAGINEAKKVLAFEATKLCHGEKAAADAAETAIKLFTQGVLGDAMPTVEITAAELPIAAFQLFIKAGLATSGGEARRLIRGGGAKLNDAKIEKEDQSIAASDFSEAALKLSAGKKQHVRVVLKV